MLVQMLWGFQFVECLKQFERKISFSMLSNILKMKKNESPTLDKILKELKEKMDFPYGRSRLHKLLKKMGFSFKFRGKERLIYERSDIIAWRERYLRAIKKFRENNPDKDIVYTDEIWLNQGHRTKKEWVDVESLKNLSRRQPGYNDLTIGCTKPSTGKGGRLIISDA